MSVWINYDDVMSQLRGFGLDVESIDVGTPKPRRVKVEGDREKRGWYWLHEFRLDSGEIAIVGSFGIWHGTDNNAQKVKLKGRELTDAQKQALKARMAADRKRADALREKEAAKASAAATNAWAKSSEQGTCDYLLKKGVGAHGGVRFTKRGNMIIPMLDPSGRIHGLQVIYGNAEDKKRKGRDKDFWPMGLAKTGHYFMIGSPSWIVLLCEGYATGASLHEATGLPVVICFDAGNILSVAQVIRKRYRTARILICADDDFASRGNPGVSAASAAAIAVSGAFVFPHFAGDELRTDITGVDQSSDDYKQRIEDLRRGRPKLTDFNDLAQWQHGGLHTVRAQVEAKLAELAWSAEAKPVREVIQTGGGGSKPLKPITSVQELFDRFAIIYGHNKSLFDFQERILISLEDMKNACSGREIWRTWMESSDKKMVRIKNVGFDPGGEDPEITCNLWGGWPTKPEKGECKLLIELLEYMCSHENNHQELAKWVLRWLAYPIRNHGAKMKTALVFHGWQGVGKNLFFEIIMAIYGEYGRVIDQSALEDKHNDTFSKKLFFIADEVIARQELYHVKGKIKGLITGDWIRINPKNVAAYNERNHVNLVFLSNEVQPIILDRDDRRFAVIWTPKQLSENLYKQIRAEIDAGGIAALHYHLLYELDMGDFKPWTRPPMTDAKRDLIEVSMDSTERFWLEWIGERIEPVPVLPVKSTRLYGFYREWCSRTGYKHYAPEPKFLAEIGKRQDGKKRPGRYVNGSNGGTKQAMFIFPPGIEQPLDKGQPEWLGECVTQFDFGVSQWREESDKAA